MAAIYARNGEVGPARFRMEAMLARMRQRGPDCTAWRSWHGCALGNNRLRVQDLRAAADQPMGGPGGRAHISLNGEIFNHMELRKRLDIPASGWSTTSDTETLIAAYEQYGEAVVEMIEGQFAFAIFDEERDALVLARDRFGICPLYFAEVGDLLVVASSVRAILRGFDGYFRKIDPVALQQYVLLRYALAPRTIVDGIRQIEPGEVVVVDRQSMRRRRYWSFVQSCSPLTDGDGAVPELASAIELAVTANCQSDAEVGMFLSAGIDSSIVAALAARKVKPGSTATTISFSHVQGDESHIASDLASDLGLRHVCAVVGQADCEALIEETIAALDVPCGARDAVAMHALAKALRLAAPDCKVVLTGTGADELFGGYCSNYFKPVAGPLTFQMEHYLTCYSAVFPQERTLVRSLLPDIDETALVARLVELAGAISSEASDPGHVLSLFYIVTHLPGWELAVADVLCMNQSLEPRVPLLHSMVAQLAMRIRGDASGMEKLPLRRTARQWLPDAVCYRAKLPLSRPVAAWLDDYGRSFSWRPLALPDIGFDADALCRALDLKLSFDIWWRLFVLDCWVSRHLN